MKLLLTCFLLVLTGAGCASTNQSSDDFVVLQTQVQQLLGVSCEVGPVTRDREINRCFISVTPKGTRCSILIDERRYLTQTEWEKRYQQGHQLLDVVVKQTNAASSTGDHAVKSMLRMGDLPDWSYRHVGVNVSIVEPEVLYPEAAQDRAEAQRCYKIVTSLLKPYRKDTSQ